MEKSILIFPVGIYMLTIETLEQGIEICSKLRHQNDLRHRFGVFIVNFEHMSHLFPMFLLLTLSRSMPTGLCFFPLLSHSV